MSKNMKFGKSDGIVLALGRRTLKEVYPIVKKDISEKQLFVLHRYLLDK